MVKKPTEKTEKPKMKCPICGHKWTPRVKNPIECPRCKTRYDYPWLAKKETA